MDDEFSVKLNRKHWIAILENIQGAILRNEAGVGSNLVEAEVELVRQLFDEQNMPTPYENELELKWVEDEFNKGKTD